ncbi:MAG: ABC transporter ATP-binding protein [Geminicoccaceae bacterium]
MIRVKLLREPEIIAPFRKQSVCKALGFIRLNSDDEPDTSTNRRKGLLVGHSRHADVPVTLIIMIDQSMPKIRIRGLKKAFGELTVLAGVDLDIPDGDNLVLLGTSGSGKTVLVKCILGLMEPDAGSILIDGEETIRRPPVAHEQLMHKIGVLFQNGALFDSLPVWQNITFGLGDRRGLTPNDARIVATEKLAAVGLGPDVIDLYPAELSGGMQKRVAFARAVVSDPEILFLDSPTAGLDPILTTIVNRLMASTIGKLQGTALTITQDMASARQIADRVALLHGGQIVWEGPTKAIDHSGNVYVDEFVSRSP